ncbi:MAG: hypothetical protein RMK01_01020 [Thermomicrobium sp.]|nr:hypothetical protein [Thermomicrobium sp.]MDW8058636.1 hypothetical protein [Thermomicrobium sp.]
MERSLRTNIAAVLVLVLGPALLLFPTECACGASEPHPHSLFALPGHRHDHGAHAAPFRSDEVSLVAASLGSLASAFVALAVLSGTVPLHAVANGASPRGRSFTRPRGWIPTLEPPPPRAHSLLP